VEGLGRCRFEKDTSSAVVVGVVRCRSEAVVTMRVVVSYWAGGWRELGSLAARNHYFRHVDRDCRNAVVDSRTVLHAVQVQYWRQDQHRSGNLDLVVRRRTVLDPTVLPTLRCLHPYRLCHQQAQVAVQLSVLLFPSDDRVRARLRMMVGLLAWQVPDMS